MPLNLQKIAEDIDAENMRLRDKVMELGKRSDITDIEKSFAALIAIETSIHQRLGDMIQLQLQTGR
jgi:hypothetical protein